MTELFNKYYLEQRFYDALLVGRNQVNRNPGNIECFEEYFYLLLKLANELPILSEGSSYLNQADVALAFFEENVELDDTMVLRISKYHSELDRVIKTLKKDSDVEADRNRKANKDQINKFLKELTRDRDRISQAKTQEKLNQILTNISITDQQIDHSLMSEKQNAIYNELNQSMTDLISRKMREFEHQKNIDYNRQAVDAFARAFSDFKTNEDTYKADNALLYELTSKSLFGYDASRLFNETLVYYNHVYSYIFSKLDDNGKLTLTRYAIECEKNLR